MAACSMRHSQQDAQLQPIATYPPREPRSYVTVFVVGAVFVAALTIAIVALMVAPADGKPRAVEHAVELAISVG